MYFHFQNALIKKLHCILKLYSTIISQSFLVNKCMIALIWCLNTSLTNQQFIMYRCKYVQGVSDIALKFWERFSIWICWCSINEIKSKPGNTIPSAPHQGRKTWAKLDSIILYSLHSRKGFGHTPPPAVTLWKSTNLGKNKFFKILTQIIRYPQNFKIK